MTPLSRRSAIAVLILAVCVVAGAKWVGGTPGPSCSDHGFSRV